MRDTERVIPDWPQIQIAESLKSVIAGPFNKGASLIVYPRRLEGDYKELTQYLLDRYKVADHDMENFLSSDLEDDLLSLSEDGRKAAQQVRKDISVIRDYIDDDQALDLRVQGAWNRTSSMPYHHDTVRRMGIRYSGNMTEEVHNDDVLGIDTGSGGECRVKENPRIVQFNHGDVWCHKGTSLFDYFTGSKPAVHRRAEPNGEPGLIITADIIRPGIFNG